MKKLLILTISIVCMLKAGAQTATSPLEKRLVDSICNCMTATDLSKITNKRDAITVITDCFGRKTDLLMSLAHEKNIDPGDQMAMKQLGTEIGIELANEKCEAFLKISEKLVLDGDTQIGGSDGSTIGKLKRIDLKGFNYIVLTDDKNDERSFIWLRQFPGSEKFMNGIGPLLGKQVRVKWHEMEVYLPQAKGYYKVKEITSIDNL